ncbi:inorganic diphosphatase [Lacimicrobium alkaliphilum]|uniref:Inorganic pyrophosphatase n=1 Tax=Lacimicrobium alkaliphilum TaxID=1526571 RepID=A0A0U3AVV6_9ALTE|nr:inorganic diphosphatase [Lacimicrobium alkaliphilum]ALS97024.1 inorganic pyrophosphatase [Lacimicrobium alkaliphilum]
MSLNDVPSGNNLPEEINVIIEIPAHSDPVKYEVDKDSGAIFVDRFMSSCMHYPTNYGYVPHTLSDDGDPVDVLVMTPFALLPGCVIRCRPVGVLKMTDESGEDAKVLAVPADKLSTIYRGITEIDQVDELLKNQIEHFFAHYKDLEPNKWVKIQGWEDSVAAKKEITESVQRYNDAPDKPAF